MIEVHLDEHNGHWDLTATVLPQGGLGIAKQAKLATIASPSFTAASAAMVNLREADFFENHERWPVAGPKFQIINDMSHADPQHFGNYRIEHGGKIIGTIENFPRGQRLALIREALAQFTQWQSRVA